MINGSKDPACSELKYSLLTGATGLVGQYLMRDMLLSGERLAVLVRPSKKQTAVQRVDQMMWRWERELKMSLPRPVVLSGSLTTAKCGLTSQDMSWLRDNTRRIIHNGAVLQFVGVDRAREPWVTNVGGTQNILNLCREINVDDLQYVSTAYVCGEQTGTIPEDRLDVGQEFRNDYERSKFEAECHVRECSWLDRPTIYRPAVISGDSENGYTSTYHGLYLYLRLIAMLVPRVPADENGIRHTPIRLPMSGSEPRNVVPVNWVSAVINRLLARPDARGLTFHLAPDVPLTPRQVVEYCYSYFNSEGVIYCEDKPAPDQEASSFEQEFLNNVQMYQAYDRSDPIFDRTNLMRFAGDLPCPVIDEETMHRYIDYGQRDLWGKRRKKVQTDFDASNPLSAILNHLESNVDGISVADGIQISVTQNEENSLPIEIGLDLQGPGGGQWQLVSNGGPKMHLKPGLPLNPNAPILHISLSDLIGKASDLDQPADTYFVNIDELSDRGWCDQLLNDIKRGLFETVN